MTLESVANELANQLTARRPARDYGKRRARVKAKVMRTLRPVFDRLSQAHEDLAEQAIYIDSPRRGRWLP